MDAKGHREQNLDPPEGAGEEVDRAEEDKDQLDNAHAGEGDVQMLRNDAAARTG